MVVTAGDGQPVRTVRSPKKPVMLSVRLSGVGVVLTSVMSRTASGRGTARQSQVTTEPARVLDVLGDEEARRVLRATDVPKTVSDLVEELELSQSTAYRKIRTLEDLGLVERTNPHARGNTPRRYRRTTGELTVLLEQDLRVAFPADGE